MTAARKLVLATAKSLTARPPHHRTRCHRKVPGLAPSEVVESTAAEAAVAPGSLLWAHHHQDVAVSWVVDLDAAVWDPGHIDLWEVAYVLGHWD